MKESVSLILMIVMRKRRVFRLKKTQGYDIMGIESVRILRPSKCEVFANGKQPVGQKLVKSLVMKKKSP